MSKKKKKEKTGMCTIMSVFGIQAKQLPFLWEFAAKARDELTGQANNDGFGWSGLGKKGGVFGERWLYPSDAFKNRDEISKEEKEFLAPFKGALFRSTNYNSFGNLENSTELTTMMLHARAATGTKALYNTHPFVHDGLSLIHNGVITTEACEKIGNFGSTCDSESILKAYIEANVRDNPKQITEATKRLFGSYAVMVQGVTKGGVPYVDIFKNDSTSLIFCTVPYFDWKVFCTRVDILKDTLKYWTEDDKTTAIEIENIYPVRAGYMVRIHAVTGEVLGVFEFEAQGWTSGGSSSTTRFDRSHHQAHWKDNRSHHQQLEKKSGTTTSTGGSSSVIDRVKPDEIRALIRKNIEDKYGVDSKMFEGMLQ